MNDPKITSPQPAAPVPAAELEREARSKGIQSDEAVEGGDSDTHLPASEAEMLKDEKLDRRPDVAITPPSPD